jgi:protein-S-isoprenylcysteine O-methyltransferase Ste14
VTTLGLAAFLYNIASRLAYVLWVGWALRREDREQHYTRAHGEAAGFARFRRIAAILMNNDAVSVLVLCGVTGWTIHALPHAWLLGAGALLTVVGLGVKLWARAAVGVDNYYWRDFFGAPPAPRVLGGPYRYLANPMYTLGNLHLWGIALAAASLPGLIAAAFNHAAILAFNHVVEQPHVRKLYGAAAGRRTTSRSGV